MSRMFFSLAVLALCATSAPAGAETRAVPYWASIRAKAVNMRVGPARAYRISWRYQRPQLPLKVLRIKEGWRLVEDPAGERGWMLATFLSPDRAALIVGEGVADVRSDGGGAGKLLWRAEPGVVGKLGDCADGWCRLDMGGGHVGYLMQSRLWGGGEP